MSDEPGNPLVEATDRLTQEVRNLGTRLRVSEEALRRQDELLDEQTATAAKLEGTVSRQSNSIKAIAALGGVLLAGLIWLWNVADAAHDATEGTKANAVTNCKNANQSREGALRLWIGVIDAPRPQGAPARTEEQMQQAADFRAFVENLYQKHDCADLSRKYPLPELPDSLKPRE